MRFKGLDLNLLVLFDALMQTRSVSRSAGLLRLSQPGISSALGRLREHFGDDLFAARGRRMYPTAYAEALAPHVQECLRAAEELVMMSASGFDTSTSQRTFRVCASDYMATALLGPLSRALAREAPQVRLDLLLNDDDSMARLRNGTIDLVIVPEDYMARDLPFEALLDERHVVVGWTGNRLLAGGTIDEAAFLAAGHVRVAVGYERTSVFSDRCLERMGKLRRFEVTGSAFALLPWLLEGTDRLAVMQERLALTMARVHDLAIAPMPFDFPIMHQIMQYHPIRAHDAGMLWLRQRLIAHSVL